MRGYCLFLDAWQMRVVGISIFILWILFLQTALLTGNNLVHQFKFLGSFIGDTYYVIHEIYNVILGIIHWLSRLLMAHHTHVHIQKKKWLQNIVWYWHSYCCSNNTWELIIGIIQQKSFLVSLLQAFGDSQNGRVDIKVEKTPAP